MASHNYFNERQADDIAREFDYAYEPTHWMMTWYRSISMEFVHLSFAGHPLQGLIDNSQMQGGCN